MTFKDGFYFNDDGVRHNRFGVEDSYPYEQLTFVGEGEGSVLDEVLDGMVENAMNHVVGANSP
jgi:hypothetical protein